MLSYGEVAREPTPFCQENSGSWDFACFVLILGLLRIQSLSTNVTFWHKNIGIGLLKTKSIRKHSLLRLQQKKDDSNPTILEVRITILVSGVLSRDIEHIQAPAVETRTPWIQILLGGVLLEVNTRHISAISTFNAKPGKAPPCLWLAKNKARHSSLMVGWSTRERPVEIGRGN